MGINNYSNLKMRTMKKMASVFAMLCFSADEIVVPPVSA